MQILAKRTAYNFQNDIFKGLSLEGFCKNIDFNKKIDNECQKMD